MNALRRRAWWYLVGVAGLVVAFGIGDILVGAAADPGIALGLTGMTLQELQTQGPDAYHAFDFTTRTQGWNLTIVGVLFLALFLVPYRAGRAWAWRVAWALPAWSLGVAALYLVVGLAPDQPPPPPLISGPLLGAIAVAVLLLDRSRFAAQAAS